jgi:hypothetical protein
MENQNPSKLSDDKIITIAQETDKFIFDIGSITGANAVELSSIILGRLMIFTQQVGCFDTFQKLMETVANMKEPNLSKTEDIKEEV